MCVVNKIYDFNNDLLASDRVIGDPNGIALGPARYWLINDYNTKVCSI